MFVEAEAPWLDVFGAAAFPGAVGDRSVCDRAGVMATTVAARLAKRRCFDIPNRSAIDYCRIGSEQLASTKRLGMGIVQGPRRGVPERHSEGSISSGCALEHLGRFNST